MVRLPSAPVVSELVPGSRQAATAHHLAVGADVNADWNRLLDSASHRARPRVTP
ncbi:hypothetical protein DFR68_1013 [Nocardia mexicana]|uniref:Uncharacterized protein n=1 Tax=Nocardia mexicana TaxID=279262 RepID=A0A370HD54_9NOCA|nr:hypothetical protein DFR68_1013 [Nocardia mexicana]